MQPFEPCDANETMFPSNIQMFHYKVEMNVYDKEFRENFCLKNDNESVDDIGVDMEYFHLRNYIN